MLKNIHRPALLTLLLLITVHSFGAVADSTKSKKDSTIVSFFYNDFEKFGNLNLHPLDTTITGYQNYDPISKQSPFYATQGNIGQASGTSSSILFFPMQALIMEFILSILIFFKTTA